MSGYHAGSRIPRRVPGLMLEPTGEIIIDGKKYTTYKIVRDLYNKSQEPKAKPKH